MATIAQWIHVSAAVVAVGGMGFMLFVLYPAVEVLKADQRDLLLKFVSGRFRWVVWISIILLIASGLYNVGLVWLVPWGLYWEVLTLKLVLAFAVFGLIACLTVPLSFFKRFQQRRRMWLSVAFTMGMLVILIAAFLRRGG